MIPEIKIEITANMVAWYGALVATGSAVVGVLVFFRDRAKIKLNWKSGWRVVNGEAYGYKNDTDYIIIEAVNKGRRPVIIGNIGYLSFSGKNGILSDSLRSGKVKIEEGESRSYNLEQSLVDLGDVAEFVAYGATGNIYRIRVTTIPKYFIYRVKSYFEIIKDSKEKTKKIKTLTKKKEVAKK